MPIWLCLKEDLKQQQLVDVRDVVLDGFLCGVGGALQGAAKGLEV
jgi:hypothetical protein